MQNTEACKRGEVILRRNRGGMLSRGQRVISGINLSIVTALMLFGWGWLGWQSDRGNYLGEVTLGWRGPRQHCWGPAGPPCLWQQPTELCAARLQRGRCTYTILHNSKCRCIHRCRLHVNLALHTHTCTHVNTSFILTGSLLNSQTGVFASFISTLLVYFAVLLTILECLHFHCICFNDPASISFH